MELDKNALDRWLTTEPTPVDDNEELEDCDHPYWRFSDTTTEEFTYTEYFYNDKPVYQIECCSCGKTQNHILEVPFQNIEWS